MTSSVKYEVDKFTSLNDFKLWQLKMHALLVQQGFLKAMEDESRLDASMAKKDKQTLYNTLLSLGGLRHVSKEKTEKTVVGL